MHERQATKGRAGATASGAPRTGQRTATVEAGQTPRARAAPPFRAWPLLRPRRARGLVAAPHDGVSEDPNLTRHGTAGVTALFLGDTIAF